MGRKAIALIFFAVITICAGICAPGCAKSAPPENKGEGWVLELPQPKGPKALTAYDIEPAEGDLWTLPIFRFNDEDEIGRFVYGNVNIYIERTSDELIKGNYIAEATFYRSADTTGKRLYFYVLMHPLRGRYADWSSADEFSFFVRNVNDFDVTLHYEIDDEAGGGYENKINLGPRAEQTIHVKVNELTANGLNVSQIKRLTLWLVDSEIRDIATLQFDDVSLTGKDKDALQAMKTRAEAESQRQLEAIGPGPRADYLPRISDDWESINEVVTRYDPGPVNGVAKCDVAVVGGGMSGCCAAIAAAQAGADVILIEAYGFLGGMATAGMVFPFMSNRAGNEDIIQGIYLEIYKRMAAEGLAERDSHRPGIIWFDKEELKYILQEMCIEAGAKLMLHTWAEAPLKPWNEENKRVEGVMVGNKSGRIAVVADITIDCTGDGDIAAAAGCPYEQGRGYDPYTQSLTLFFRMGNVNTGTALGELYKRLSRTQDNIPAEYLFKDKFDAAKSKGDLDADLPVDTIYFERTLSPGVVSVNATRVFKINPTDVLDLSYAEIETRDQVHQLSRFLIKYIPGFERAFLQESAIQIGVRESRRIVGEYMLTGRDVLSAAKFDDVIARGAFGIDIHCADYSGCGITGLKLEEGSSYDIPYRCLVPKEVDGILVAGRCISASHIAFGSVRIMPVVSATGQAAGAAAALCVKDEVQPRDLDVTELQKLLIAQGANLGR